MNLCPTCKGEKRPLAHVNPGPGRPHRWERLPCPTCKGAGEVDDEHLARIENGRQMRAERLARLEGLNEAAKRLGMTPAELSAIERGTV